MQLHLLTIEKIKELVKEEKFNVAFLQQILQKKGLPSEIIRYLSTHYSGAAHRKFMEYLENTVESLGLLSDDSILNQDYEVVNLLYFFPKFSAQHFEQIVPKIYTLSVEEFRSILRNKQICELLLKMPFLKDTTNEGLRKSIFLLMAGFFHKIFLNQAQEIALLKDMLTASSYNNVLMAVINSRIKSLSQKKETSFSKMGRCALLISGQFRLPFIDVEAVLKRINSVIKVDEVFISSWDKVGVMNFDFLSKVISAVDENLQRKVQDGEISIEHIAKICKEQFINQENLVIPNKEGLRVILNNENVYPYRQMTAPQKMYFNNEVWVGTLGDQYFLDNFDTILKIRPDSILTRRDDAIRWEELTLKDNTIYANSGFSYKEEGLVMGDMFLYGKTKDMLPMLKIHSNVVLERFISWLYNWGAGNRGYQGHLNMAVCAWMNALDVELLEYFHHSLGRFCISEEMIMGERTTLK